MFNNNNNSFVDANKKSSIREKRFLQARQEKLARILNMAFLTN